MLNSPCQVLLIEDEPEDIKLVQSMLDDVCSGFFKGGFELACAETLSEAKQIISDREFDVILLDLVLPDSRSINSLKELQTETKDLPPIIVQTALEDEVIAVKALEMGACGYLPKVASDRNLLLYAIRSAIERKLQLAKIEQSRQQQQELNILEDILIDVCELGSNSLLQRMPDIAKELSARYRQLLDRFVEERIYQVESELSSQINVFIEQLGYLQASPGDLIELHTTVIRQIQKTATKKNSKAFIFEGRFLLLKLMGKLAAYYRRYYIGLNKINLNQSYYNNMPNLD